MFGNLVFLVGFIVLAASGYLLYAGATGMRYLGLFLFSTVVWFLVTLAAAMEKSLEAARTGKPAGGTSFVQYLLFIVGFTYVAWLVDRWWPPYGLWGVFMLHAVLGAYALIAGVWSAVLLHRLQSRRPPEDTVNR